MGFRDYSPGLNRFLTRDSYNGALADLHLGLDPFTGNRYAFAGGNPITGIELDGHILDDCASSQFNCSRWRGGLLLDDRAGSTERRRPSGRRRDRQER